MDIEYARQKVGPPAIGLMIFAVLDFLVNLLTLVVYVLRLLGVGLSALNQDQQSLLPNAFSGVYGIITAALSLICAVVVFVGANKMRKLENRSFALVASVIPMVPCLASCCCVAGIPLGIWSLITLNDEKVRESFVS